MILCVEDNSLIDKLDRKLYKYFDENDIEIEEDEEVVSLFESHQFDKLFSLDEFSILKDYYRRIIKYKTLYSEACEFGCTYDFEGNLSKAEITKLAKHLKNDCIIFRI